MLIAGFVVRPCTWWMAVCYERRTRQGRPLELVVILVPQLIILVVDIFLLPLF